MDDPEQCSDDDPEAPLPQEGWWRLRPGIALDEAYEGYTYGVSYYGFALDGPPTCIDLDRTRWNDLQRVYRQAKLVADVARTLLHPPDGELSEPAAVTEGRKLAQEFQVYSILNYPLLREDPGGDLEGPAAAYHLYEATLLFEVARLLPGIHEERLQEGFTRMRVDTDHVLAERINRLVKHRIQLPNHRTASYLSLVARCYLLGMRSELAAVSRAALETALEEFAPDELVRKKLGADRGGKVGLSRRIDYCRAEGVFDRDTERAASAVKNAGDDVLHFVPGTEPTPEVLLDSLVQALAALGQASRG